MKKCLFILSLFFLLLGGTGVCAYQNTGHPSFEKIIIPAISKAQLLIDMKQKTIDESIKKVRGRAFGWSVSVNANNQAVDYIGETIFSRSNNTRDALVFSYKSTESSSEEITKSVSGTVGVKLSGKIKVLTAGLDAAVKMEAGVKQKEERTTVQEYKITVYPKTKVTVRLKGEARLNNGGCKYFFLGIPFKKGMWETIDIINQYHDFYEEKLY